MRDVEIGFKFHDGMAEVPVMGRGKDIVAAFSILAASIARNSGIPLGVLIAAAVDADKKLRQNRGQGHRGRLQRAASAEGRRRELKLRFKTNTETERNQEKG